MSDLKLQPIGNRVVAKRVEAESESPGGIVLPDSAKEEMQECEILAVGPGRYEPRIGSNGKDIPIPLNVGDRVLIGPYGAATAKVDGEELLVLDAATDILAKVGE